MHRQLVPISTSGSAAFRVATAGLQRVAFWGAVLLPLGFLPVLSLDGRASTVAALVAVNVVCLLVGHDYSPDP